MYGLKKEGTDRVAYIYIYIYGEWQRVRVRVAVRAWVGGVLYLVRTNANSVACLIRRWVRVRVSIDKRQFLATRQWSV
jgi:hypothetical protein